MNTQATFALQLVLSSALVGGFWLIVLCREFLWAWKPPRKDRQYLDETAFEDQMHLLGCGNEAAALAFAQRAESVYDLRRDSAKRLEDKASAILSFVGGASGLVALLAGSDKIVHVQPTLLLATASLFLFGVFACTILVQYPRSSPLINARRLSAIELLQSSAGAARMAALTGWEFLECSRLMAVRVREKALWLSYAQTTFAFGVVAIVLNVLVTSMSPNDAEPSAAALHCTVGAAAVDCRLGPAKKATP